MMKIRNIVRDEQLVSCVISGSGGGRKAFAVLIDLASLRPRTEVPKECRGMFRKAIPVIRAALSQGMIPSVSDGGTLSISIPCQEA